MRICPVLTSRLLPPRARPLRWFYLAILWIPGWSSERNLGHSERSSAYDHLRGFEGFVFLKAPNSCPREVFSEFFNVH